MATTYGRHAERSLRTERDALLPGASHGVDAATIRARLVPPMPGRLAGWVGPLLVTALAGFLRFWRLGVPRGIVFDEVYYAHDALSLLHHGVELDAPSGDQSPGYVVHPPLGKWMISFGEWLFHSTEHYTGKGDPPWTYAGAFGWRFSSAVAGTLAVLILARTARRMTRSNVLGCVAGLLLALDGLAFVESRFALLDIFLMLWVVAAFACLVADRDAMRARYAAAVQPGADGLWRSAEPARHGVRWWLVGAGVCLGAACAVKWDGVWFLPAFVLLAVLWEAGARRTAGLEPYARRTLDGAWWFAVGSASLLPVIKFYHFWAWSLATAVALPLLWELAALRPGGRAGRRVALGAWAVVAVATLYGAYHLVRFGDTRSLSGSTRNAGPPHVHWLWFGLAVVLVALTALAGRRRPHLTGRWRSPSGRGWQVPVALGAAPAAVYVASWIGWFVNSSDAYAHDTYVRAGMGTLSHAHAVFKGWLSYHFQAYWFHAHLYSPHQYASRPLSWLVLQRPVAYFYQSPADGVNGCTASGGCAREVLALGNPAVFWGALVALLATGWLWASRRDWRAAAVLVCFAAGYLTWFPFSGYLPGTGSKSRTEFLFYVLDVVPFMVLAITLVLGWVIGGRDATPRRRLWGSSAAGAYVLTVVVLFFYFYPVLAAVSIPKGTWDNLMWFSSWI
ncbi:MAG: dolichyl-phosphate-mannose--protein mannosyltransferase [Frankiaceae bacterium]